MSPVRTVTPPNTRLHPTTTARCSGWYTGSSAAAAG